MLFSLFIDDANYFSQSIICRVRILFSFFQSFAPVHNIDTFALMFSSWCHAISLRLLFSTEIVFALINLFSHSLIFFCEQSSFYFHFCTMFLIRCDLLQFTNSFCGFRRTNAIAFYVQTSWQRWHLCTWMIIATAINSFRRLIFIDVYELDLYSMLSHAYNGTIMVAIEDSYLWSIVLLL